MTELPEDVNEKMRRAYHAVMDVHFRKIVEAKTDEVRAKEIKLAQASLVAFLAFVGDLVVAARVAHESR